jgi:antitoxin CcdA
MPKTKAKVTLTIDSTLSSDARALGLNMSQLAEHAIRDAVKLERNARWVAENSEALDTYADEVERDGPALSRFRSF